MKKFKIHCSQIGKIMGASKPVGGLSQTCKTFLHEWYAGDNEQVYSKYMDKGNICENENIEFAVKVLNLGFALKNIDPPVSDEYIIGSCDVKLSDCIIDVKSPWNIKTLQSNIHGMDSDYEWQGIGYMHLYKKEKFILFYGLMDTPSDVNFDNEVIYSHLPDNERWIAYSINHDQSKVDEIINQVIKCRAYLNEYDLLVKNRMGKIL